MDIQNMLEMIAVSLAILTGLIGLIRILILSPLDRKLETHSDKLITQIEERFLDAIEKRITRIEEASHGKSRQGLLWAKHLHEKLEEQGIKSPNPHDYVWDAQSKEVK